ncbi:DEAD/DEAH box helicase [bacterium]|jgi:superfamily II DNA/RNA helicase|nr:DEAD/DEAH box helicase [bacterium]MBT3795340.1 DEAD/DEAH box helicase [bacterium]
MGFVNPTPIQEQSIPIGLKGLDILGSAQTGTGKTAAFGIPIIENLNKDKNGIAVILAPTRELAKQIYDVIRELLGYRNTLKVTALIGGESITNQLRNLKRGPRIIIGTPGRINDHINRKSLYVKKTKILVLDETDRMLDMGFGIQIDEIVRNMTGKRQTLMFSATIPDDISRLADKYLVNPQRISIGSINQIPKSLKQEILKIRSNEKYDQLVEELKNRSGSVLVFIKTKYACDRMAKKLSFDGVKATAIHGDLKQNRRNRIISDFRNNKFSVLIGTDIVCRGLDVPQIEHVINFDLPQVAEDFIHRIGRTARAGMSGSVVSFITPNDHLKWRAIQKILDPKTKNKISDITSINHKDKVSGDKVRTNDRDKKKASTKNFSKDSQKRKKTFSKNAPKDGSKKKKYENLKKSKSRNKKRLKKPILLKSDNRAKFVDEEIVYKIIKESR